RAMAATAVVSGRAMTVASWHAPHAAGRSVLEKRLRREQKMRAYRAMEAWIVQQRGPLVLGGDMNTWQDDRDGNVLGPEHPHYDEYRFHRVGAAHGLVDADRMDRARRAAEGDGGDGNRGDADGAEQTMAVTYDRGHGGRSIPCRMDRIYVSKDVVVRRVEHRSLGEAREAGSDHAVVRAECAVGDR
ncbi:MAG: endonuclease/exonuclease/phosphatase family protein, partial [Ardenticatenales bacterium]